MGTSTLRFAIIVALVVGGVLLIDQAFPEDSTGSLPRPTDTTSPPTSPPSPNATETNEPDGGDGQQPAPKVVVGVYNGTFEDGLAGTVAEQITKRGGYRVPETAVGNTPFRPREETTIYYRTQDDQAAADGLVADFFAKRGLADVPVERMPTDLEVPGNVDVVIYVGTDYANI